MILDVAPTELMVLGVVALLVIPPKDLPRAMRFAGQWVGKARGLARQFRSGFDDMIREGLLPGLDQVGVPQLRLELTDQFVTRLELDRVRTQNATSGVQTEDCRLLHLY